MRITALSTAAVAHRGSATVGQDAGAPCRPLGALAGSAVAHRFRSWTGRSGRRYVFSVYLCTDGRAESDDAPPVGAAVVIGVERTENDRRAVRFVADTGPSPDLFFGSDRVRSLLRRPGSELHVHLMAGDIEERRRIAADLSAA